MSLLQDAPEPRVGVTSVGTHSNPDVSVCIVNWNCRELLRKCLHSLYNQPQGADFEVIVVDNASADGAARMVAEEFPQVRLVCNPDNRGFSRANNQAAQMAVGRYFFFLNNDTEVPANTLGDFASFADRNPGVGMVGPRLRGADGRHQISYRQRPTLAAMLHRISILRWTCLFRRAYYRYRRDTYEPTGIRAVECLMGAAVFLPRAVFEQSGRWDERYHFGGEDLDLSTQVGRKHELVYFSNVEILHYGRVSSRENPSFAAPNVAIGYVHYFRKAGVGPVSLLLYKLLVTMDTPVQIGEKMAQGVIRRLRGRPEKARKSWLAARGLRHFFFGELVRFWKA